jgi:hypothetical protein
MKKSTRIEWQELRGRENKELFMVIAEKDDKGHWEFYERTSWDVAWIKKPASITLMARLGQEQKRLEQQGQQQQKPQTKELRRRMDENTRAIQKAHEQMARTALNRAANRPKQRY